MITGINVVTKSLAIDNDTDRTFTGFATVEVVDKENEYTTAQELYKTLDTWMKRGAPLNFEHTNQVIGKGLSYEYADFEYEGMKIPGVLIKGQVYNHTNLDNKVWDMLKSGELTGLSYGGSLMSAKQPLVQNDGTIVYKLNDLETYEISLCRSPMNPLALIMDINNVAKAMQNKVCTLRDDQKVCFACDKLKFDSEKKEFVNIIVKNADKQRFNNPNNIQKSIMESDHESKKEVENEEKEKSFTVSEIKEIASLAVKAEMYDNLVNQKKADDEKGGDDDGKDDEGEDTEKISKTHFDRLIDVVQDYITKSDARFESLESLIKNNSGGTDTDGQSEDSEPKEDTIEDNTEKADVVKSERPEVISKSDGAISSGLDILDQVRKGVSLETITKQVASYGGVN